MCHTSQLPHHLPSGVDAGFATKHRVVLRTLFYVFIVLHHVECLAQIIGHVAGVTYQVSCLVGKRAMVSEIGIGQWRVYAKLVANIAQDGNVEVSSLRPKTYILFALLFFEIIRPFKQIIHCHLYRSAWKFITVAI